jgi:hypothetical protein
MLSLLQAQIESIYRTRGPDIRDFLVDRRGLAALVGDDQREADEWILVREGPGGLDIAVYIGEEHLELLAQAQDLREATDGAFRAVCAAVEGVSHFLFLVERALRGEPVRLLELEAQAEVDKYVLARLHHPDRGAEWMRRLFFQATLHGGMAPAEEDRYREAGRLAAAFCAHLEALPHDQARLSLLRSFWRDCGHRRMDRMRRLAA